VAKRLIPDKEECVVIIEMKLTYVHSNAFILYRKMEYLYSEMEAKLK
jgi:hypothetical protein